MRDIAQEVFDENFGPNNPSSKLADDIKSATLDMAVSIAKSDTAKLVNTDKPGSGISPFAKTIIGDDELVVKKNQYLNWMKPVEKQSFYLKMNGKPMQDQVEYLDKLNEKRSKEKIRGAIDAFKMAKDSVNNSIEIHDVITDNEMTPEDKNQKLLDLMRKDEELQIKGSMTKDPTFGAAGLGGSWAGYATNPNAAKYIQAGTATGAGVGSTVGGVGAIPGTIAGFTTGLTLAMTTSSYKEGYGTMAKDMLRNGASLEDAQNASKIGGVLYASIELSQLKKIPGGQVVGKKLAIPIIKQAVKDYGWDVVENVGQEAMQRLTTDTFTDLATLRSKGLSEQEVMSEMVKNVGKYAKNMGEEAKASALAFAIVGAPGKTIATYRAISTARADYKALNNAGLTGQLAEQYRQVSDVLANNGIEAKDIVQIKDKVRTATGQDASGVVEGGIISLAKSVKDTTGAHESFHYLANQFGNSEQYQKALEEVKKNENVNDAQANEILADKFAEYRKTKIPTAPVMDQLFASISEGIRKVFGKEKSTQKLFDMFNSGEMADEVRAKNQKSILDNHRQAFDTKVKNEHSATIEELKQSSPVIMRSDMESQAEYDPLTGALHINEKTTLNKSQKDAIMQQVETSKMKIPDNKVIEISDGNETIKLKAREVSAKLSRKLNNLLKLKDCLGR